MGIAALIVAGGVLISRVLGQIREMIFAGMLGANEITDQYVAAFRIPDFLNYLLAGGFLSITFIPIFTRYLAADDEAGGWEALTAIIRPIAAGIIGLVVVGWAAAPAVIDLIYPDFTQAQLDATVRLTRIVLPAQLFFVLGALFAAVQYAKGKFLVPSLAPVAYNAGIIVGGITFAVVSGEADPEGFAWGALAGAFAGNLVLQWWGARRAGMKLVPGTGWKHPALREYVLIALPLMIGQSIVVLDETFTSVFGDLSGDGAQTQLQYARRTMYVPVGAIAQAVGVAAYPFLARLFASGRLRALGDTVDRALRWVLGLSIVAAALLAALSVPTIRILFERFQFGPGDTKATASALFFFSLAIPIWGASQLVTRAFYARREMWTPVVVGSAATAAAVPTYWILQRSFGLRGVAVASVLTLGSYTIALTALWYRKPEHTGRLAPVLEAAGRAMLPAFAGGMAAFSISWRAMESLGDGFMAALLALLLGVAAFTGTALAVVVGMWTLLKRKQTPDPRHQTSDS